MTYTFLQHYWWVVVSLLGGLLVFLMFVQGGNLLLASKLPLDKKRLVLNSTGRKWELTFTTLVTFGGAFFASFPLFYSTSFGGAYWVWVLLLVTFVFQAVSYEFQNKRGNVLGSNFFRACLVANGLLAPVLVGTAVGTFFTGSDFTVDLGAIAGAAAATSGAAAVASGAAVAPAAAPVASGAAAAPAAASVASGAGFVSAWGNPWHGLEAVASPAILLGLVVLFLASALGCLYVLSNVHDPEVETVTRKKLRLSSALFLIALVAWLGWWLTADGFAVGEDGVVAMEPYKYAHNLLAQPLVLVMLLLGAVLVVYGLYLGSFGSASDPSSTAGPSNPGSGSASDPSSTAGPSNLGSSGSASDPSSTAGPSNPGSGSASDPSSTVGPSNLGSSGSASDPSSTAATSCLDSAPSKKAPFRKGIWPAGLGTILVVLSIFLVAGFGGTAFYPSSTDLQSSLTIENASSSPMTLKVMFYVSLLIPFVLAYIAYAWHQMDRKPLTSAELSSSDSKY